MKYTIYALVDGRGKPYYIGKTANYIQRRKAHLKALNSGDKAPRYVKARQLRRRGGKFRMKALAKALSERDANTIERAFIKDYRKRGGLTNLTWGAPDEVLISNGVSMTKYYKKKNAKKKTKKKKLTKRKR